LYTYADSPKVVLAILFYLGYFKNMLLLLLLMMMMMMMMMNK